MTAAPVPRPVIPVLAERGGTQLKTPRPVFLVDTGNRTRSILPALMDGSSESKSGPSNSATTPLPDWKTFVSWSEKTFPIWFIPARSLVPPSSIVCGCALSQVKSPYSHSKIDPNRIMQFSIAALAGLQVPFVSSETHELGEELVASYLYQIHLHPWLEANAYGRFLTDDDL